MSGRCAEIFQVRTSTSSIVNSGDEDFSKDQCKRERERERDGEKERQEEKERVTVTGNGTYVCLEKQMRRLSQG